MSAQPPTEPRPAMGMPEMPYRMSVKRNSQGKIVDVVLTVGSMSAERFKGEVPALLEWFANLNLPGASKAEDFEFNHECSKCGATGEDAFYDNTGDKKPNFKCKNCETKFFVKRKGSEASE